jgi:hypothetical protein
MDGADLFDGGMGGAASEYSVRYGGTGWLNYGAGMNFNLEGCKDVSDYTGVSFWAKGSSKNEADQTLKMAEDNALNFRVTTAGSHGIIMVDGVNVGGDCDTSKPGCFNPPQTNIELTSEWKQYKVTFAELKVPSGAAPNSAINAAMDNVMLLGWHSENATFDFAIDQVEFY